jgi:hypothetical protein
VEQQTKKECKTLSKMWRESGKQMPFKQFATLYNSGELDAYYSKAKFVPKKGAVPIETTLSEVACKEKTDHTKHYLQILGIGFIVLGAIYFLNKQKK